MHSRHGVVGYHVRSTCGRSPVRTWMVVLWGFGVGFFGVWGGFGWVFCGIVGWVFCGVLGFWGLVCGVLGLVVWVRFGGFWCWVLGVGFWVWWGFGFWVWVCGVDGTDGPDGGGGGRLSYGERSVVGELWRTMEHRAPALAPTPRLSSVVTPPRARMVPSGP